MENFGERFKKLRLDKGLTQDQLVEEFNNTYGYSFTKATISQYEHNKRTPEMNTIKKFIEYFDVSLDYLLCNDNSIIKELGGQYGIYKSQEAMELKDTISILKNLIKDKGVKINNKNFTKNQERLLLNCLDIAYELVNRE